MTNLGFVHRFVAATRQDCPVTLLLLHGTGGNEQDLLPLGQALLPGAALLSPRGNVLENGMPRFFRRLAEGVFDIDDLKKRTRELTVFLGAARKEYHLEGKLVAAGYSNGANIASSLMLLYPGLLAGGVLLRPMVPFVPAEPTDLQGTRVLLAGGKRDRIVPPEQTVELARILGQAGASVEIHWHEGGHELGQDDVDAARRWLAAP